MLIDLGNIVPSYFHELDEYERCYENRLFEDKVHPFDKDFTGGGPGQPQQYIDIEDRKPLVEIALGKQITETVASYTFGPEHYPKVTVTSSDVIFGGELSASNRELDGFYTKLEEVAELRTSIMDLARKAISVREAIAYIHLVDGVPGVDTIDRKWVRNLVTHYHNTYKIISFDEIKLELNDEEDQLYWHKRSFDEDATIEYVPQPFNNGDQELPEFTEIADYTVHNLGWCPAILLSNVGRKSIFANQIENIKQYSYFESSILIGMRKNQHPQKIWMGEGGVGSQNLIRANDGMWTLPPGKFVSDSPNPQAYLYSMQQEARLRDLIFRGSGIIELDEKYQSGEAMKMKLAPELNLIADTRGDLGDKGYKPLIVMLFKFIEEMNERIVYTSEYESGVRAEVVVGNLEIPKSFGSLEVYFGWGEIVIPTSKSKNMDVQTAVMAANPEGIEEPLFSQKTMRKYLSDHFGVRNLNDEMLQIEMEKRERVRDKVVDSIIETAKDLGSLEVLIELYDIYSNGSIDFQSEYKEGIDAIDLSSLSTLVEEIKSEKDEAENESTQPSEDDQAIGMERQDSGTRPMEVRKAPNEL